jgi:hypothetical protein
MVAYKSTYQYFRNSRSNTAKLLEIFFKTDKGIDIIKEHIAKRDALAKSIFRRSTYNFSSCTTNFAETPWGRDLRNDRIQDPRSPIGKRFRRRFRVPYPLFLSLWAFCDENNIFGEKRKHRVLIPVEIKLLICLRLMGRGECTDTIEECSGVKIATVNKIFKTYLRNFTKFKHIFIPEPTEEEILDNMLVYNQLGLPGAIGSVDCTHLHWRMCPTELYNFCKGKYDFATVAFQVCVNHNRKIMSVSDMFYGAQNDKTINRYDVFVTKVAEKKLYKDIEFILTALDGSIIKLKGIYFITDNGYNEDDHFMMPSKLFANVKEMYWSEWMESVRKDVECTFGAMKTRFRILWNGIMYHDKDIVEHIFVTACMLHNIILGYDADGSTEWEKGVDWEELHPVENLAEDVNYEEEEKELDPANCFYEAHDNIVTQTCVTYNDELEHSIYYIENIDVMLTSDALIKTSRDLLLMWPVTEYKKLILINHYSVMYKNGMVTWPKAFEARLKTLMPIKRNANAERVVSNLRVPMVDISQVYCLLFILYYNCFN